MRKKKPGHYLLFRKEDGQNVWIYEYLQWHELKSRMRKGWKVVP